ncbi:MAG: GTPase HflX [Deltaproteobacteria bacterium]|nr:GTPase HflX [Deltaproteobacteria bacterium]MCL5878781.1 GTPase HflX [Deltaproteobacteria bacterium]
MTSRQDRVLAVNVLMEREPAGHSARHMAELASLIQADGGTVVETMTLKVRTPNSSTLIGSGQISRLGEAAEKCNADVIVLNRELNPQQQRNIETVIDQRLIIDRTRLIIDIFARHASSREGKLEVEDALLRYMLPRLTGKGIVMSQTGGGVGTRGPGETKLEMDKRRIKERLGRIKQLIETMKKQRLVQHGRRNRTGIPLVSLVGYTSAGKSTLLNTFTGAGVRSSENLFTTLDPISRKLHLENGSFTIITDTVGFIDDLPIQLIKAFRTTLEDVAKSDLLLLVVDVSKPDYEDDIRVVRNVLGEIDADKIATIYVFNKADRIDNSISLKSLTNMYGRSILVSALQGTGIEELKNMILMELMLKKHGSDIRDNNELYGTV